MNHSTESLKLNQIVPIGPMGGGVCTTWGWNRDSHHWAGVPYCMELDLDGHIVELDLDGHIVAAMDTNCLSLHKRTHHRHNFLNKEGLHRARWAPMCSCHHQKTTPTCPKLTRGWYGSPQKLRFCKQQGLHKRGPGTFSIAYWSACCLYDLGVAAEGTLSATDSTYAWVSSLYDPLSFADRDLKMAFSFLYGGLV